MIFVENNSEWWICLGQLMYWYTANHISCGVDVLIHKVNNMKNNQSKTLEYYCYVFLPILVDFYMYVLICCNPVSHIATTAFGIQSIGRVCARFSIMYISISIARVKYHGFVYVIYVQNYVIYVIYCKSYLVAIFANVWFALNDSNVMGFEIHKLLVVIFGYDIENNHPDVYE